MISKEMLGRYECVDASRNEKKYWWLVFDRDTNEYVAHYGRIGNRAQQKVYVGDDTAMKKIKEKLKKGYHHLAGYETDVGSNAGNFILSILDKEVA